MPTTPDSRMMSMGFSLRTEPTSARANIAQLHPSMKLRPSSEVGKISRRAAEAIIPMTTGRIPPIMPRT